MITLRVRKSSFSVCWFFITSKTITIFHWVDLLSIWLDQWHPVGSCWRVYSEQLLTNTKNCFMEKAKQRIISLLKRIQSAMIWRLKNSLWHLSLQHQRDICSITAQSVSRRLVHNFITFPFCLPQSPPVILSFISLVFLPYLKPKPTVAHLKSICHDLQLP